MARKTKAEKAAELKAVMAAPKLKLKTPSVRRRVSIGVLVNVHVEVDVRAEDPDDLEGTTWEILDVVRIHHPSISESDVREQPEEVLEEIDRRARAAEDLEAYDD